MINRTGEEDVKQELISIKKNLLRVEAWKKEINVIESKLNAYSANELGFKSNASFDLSTIIENDQARLEILKSNIDYTNYRVEKMKARMILLNDEENQAIELKYLNPSLKLATLRNLSEKMNLSKDTVNNLLKNAIQKMAEINATKNVK